MSRLQPPATPAPRGLHRESGDGGGFYRHREVTLLRSPRFRVKQLPPCFGGGTDPCYNNRANVRQLKCAIGSRASACVVDKSETFAVLRGNPDGFPLVVDVLRNIRSLRPMLARIIRHSLVLPWCARGASGVSLLSQGST